MFGFIKKMFSEHEDKSGCKSSVMTNDNTDVKEHLLWEKRLQAAHEQDRIVRECMSEKQIDKGLKDTMEASDPVAKY